MDTINPVVVRGLGWPWLWDLLLMEMAGRESLLDPSQSREHGEPHRRGQDRVNWDLVKAPQRLLPSLPGTGVRAATGCRPELVE